MVEGQQKKEDQKNIRGRANWKYLWRAAGNYFAVLLLIRPSLDKDCMRVVYIINSGHQSVRCFPFRGVWLDDRKKRAITEEENQDAK